MHKCHIVLSLFVFVTHYMMGQEIQFTPTEKAWIAAHPIIQFGYEPNWEPYEIYENGEYTGIVGDYIHKIEAATGIDMIPIKDITWNESLEGLKNGEIHVVPSCGVTSERKEFLEFTEPYIEDPLVIVTREDYHFISSLEDLRGKKIALPVNYYTLELISQDYPDILIVKLKNIQTCLEYLRDGKVDAFVGDLGVISYYVNKKGFDEIKIASPTKYKASAVAFAVTKDWKIFRNIVQKVLDTIDVTQKNSIRKEWISVRYEHGFPWRKAFYWISIIGGIVCLVFLFFFYWNRSLKRQIQLRKEFEEQLKLVLDKVKKQDYEKKILLQEIHHRVKNNLQIIISLIRMHANSHKNENAVIELKESIDRIRAVALIHEKTYNSYNLNQISIKEYIESLTADIMENFRRKKDLDIEIITDETSIDSSKIVPLALILNELITNSIKFGVKDFSEATIRINLMNDRGGLRMIYFDNGIWVDNPESKKLGTSIIEIFTAQLKGMYELNKTEEGTEYHFLFEI